MESIKSFKILTFNTGLLDLKLLGKHLLQPAPHVKERLMGLPRALIRHKADVIALQEVYEQKHKQYLISELESTYPHHYYSRKKSLLHVQSSLMFFSKFPFISKWALPLKKDILEDKLFAYKGILAITIDLPGIGHTTLYNFHTAAGGIRNQDSLHIAGVREAQIHQVITSIEKHRNRNIQIVLGDINAGPEICRSNYEIFGKSGFIDSFLYKHPRQASSIFTWDPKNTLNADGPHTDSPPQRIDHIFFREKDAKRVHIKNAEIVFTERRVHTGIMEKVTLSDHYALSVTIEPNSA